MTDQAELVDAGASGPVRVDWRTGRAMVQHDEAFWHDHEQRRLEQGLSVPQYCAANALALSTYRHRVSGKKRLERGRFTDPARLGAGGIAMSELVAWLEGIDLSRTRRLQPLDVSVVA